ncbi:hypothetical protein MCANUF31_01711 [Mycoplasmopsis canis UF31]|nr:hypothetical protein MCANUF31_01711 [Mycoplasmopsis canis UF31]EIE41547.1 hypothetical protein MCANUFG1_01671 [Mycoplasmopsis canis UFG1]
MKNPVEKAYTYILKFFFKYLFKNGKNKAINTGTQSIAAKKININNNFDKVSLFVPSNNELYNVSIQTITINCI